MKLFALVAVPAGVVTLTLPVFAAFGTTAVSFVAETTVKFALAPPILTPVGVRRGSYR